MENIKTTLEAHKLTLDNVVKCTIMLENMADWPAFNEVYAIFFKRGRYPPRSAFGASGLALGAKSRSGVYRRRLARPCSSPMQRASHAPRLN
jgi:enamine deaminase RidA (YjgF/YER057c/UK114 family)